MINRMLTIALLAVSTAIACEPNYMALDETTSDYNNPECVQHAQALLQQAIRRADMLYRQPTSDQLIKQFVQKNGTAASFSPNTRNREAGQEMVDQILNKNLSDQPIKSSSKTKRIKQWIAHRAKL